MVFLYLLSLSLVLYREGNLTGRLRVKVNHEMIASNREKVTVVNYEGGLMFMKHKYW